MVIPVVNPISNLFFSKCKDSNCREKSLVPHISVTKLRRNPIYSTYYINLAVLLVLGIIPLSLLAYFNCVIYQQLKPPTILLRSENRGSTSSQISNFTNHEKEMARVLIGIVIMFVFCHFLRLMINFYEMMVFQTAIACELAGKNDFPLWGFMSITCSEFMLVLNSSLNIVIYCCINGNFRKKMKLWKDFFKSDVTHLRDNRSINNKEEIKMHIIRHFSISSEGIGV